MKKIAAYFRMLRIEHYVKNGFIMLPVFFGAKLLDPGSVVPALVALVAFSIVASGVYVLNDLIDRDSDREHPVKKKRPIASRVVGTVEAIVLASTLFASGAVIAFLFLNVYVLALIALYALLNVMYSAWLKRVPVVDVCAVSCGFVIRVFVGSLATGIQLSHWLILMTFLLALFLSLGKRKADVAIFIDTGKQTRRVVNGYSDAYLDVAISLVAGVVIVFYVQYTVSTDVIAHFKTDKLYFTVVFVVVGVLRYLQQIIVLKRSSDPTQLFLEDRMLQVCVGLWVASVGALIYL